VPYIQDECTEMSDNFKKNMNQFLSGMKRTVAKAKAESGESLDEGKKYMSFEVYSKLCDLLFIGKVGKRFYGSLFRESERRSIWRKIMRAMACVLESKYAIALSSTCHGKVLVLV